MIRLWQQKSGNSRLILHQILFGNFQISAHSYRQTIPTLQAAKGTLLLPGGAGDWGKTQGGEMAVGLWASHLGRLGHWESGLCMIVWHLSATPPYHFTDSRMQWWQNLSLYLPWTTSWKYQDKAKANKFLRTFLLFLSFFFFAGRGGLSKKKRAPEERRSTTCLDAKGRTVLIKRTHWLKSPNTKYLEPSGHH